MASETCVCTRWLTGWGYEAGAQQMQNTQTNEHERGLFLHRFYWNVSAPQLEGQAGRTGQSSTTKGGAAVKKICDE